MLITKLVLITNTGYSYLVLVVLVLIYGSPAGGAGLGGLPEVRDRRALTRLYRLGFQKFQ